MITYVFRIHTSCHDPMPEHGLLVIHSASLSSYHIWLKQYRLWTYFVWYILVALLPTMPPWLAIFLLQVSSAPHVDGRGQVVDSACAALLPSTSQFQVLRAMADEGMDDGIWRMNKDDHRFFCCKALLTILPPPLIVFFLVAMYAPIIVEKWSNLTLFDAHSCENVWLKVDFTAVASAYPRKNEDDSWRIGLGSRTNLNLTTNLPWTDFPCRWGTANCKLRVPLSMRCLRTENPNSSTPTTDQK